MMMNPKNRKIPLKIKIINKPKKKKLTPIIR